MSTVSIQNMSHFFEGPKVFLIVANGQNIFLAPQGEKIGFALKVLRTKGSLERTNAKTGEVLKDVHGNVRTQDGQETVIVRDPAREARSHWSKCPEDLFEGIERGTYEHVYTTGDRIPKTQLTSQRWYKPGYEAYKLVRTRVNAGQDLARVEDIVGMLERRLQEREQASLPGAEEEALKK